MNLKSFKLQYVLILATIQVHKIEECLE